jgi:Skp family chaperone for outer membrane proteins
LLAVKQNTVNQLEEVRKGLGEAPTQDEAKNFIRLQQTANLKFNQLKQEADAQLGQHRQRLIDDFRKDAKPIAEKVAKTRGFSTVVTKNDSFVFAYDEGVDITSEVIQLMSAEAPARPAARTAAKPEQQTASIPAQNAAAPAAAQSSSQPAPAN